MPLAKAKIRQSKKQTLSILFQFLNQLELYHNIMVQPNLYYHGSAISLPVGTILMPRPDYEKNWCHTDFYTILEKYRPLHMLGHAHAVFVCETDEDVDLAGGSTNYLFTVKLLGRTQRHDLNWSSEISMLKSEGYADNSPEIIKAAFNYWAGHPHINESVWEILTERAEIIKVEEY